VVLNFDVRAIWLLQAFSSAIFHICGASLGPTVSAELPVLCLFVMSFLRLTTDECLLLFGFASSAHDRKWSALKNVSDIG